MISCKICGDKFKNLTSHINAKHNMNKDSYLQLYPGAEIVSAELSAQFSSRSKLMHKKLKEDNYSKYMQIRKTTCEKMRTRKGDNFKHSDKTIEKMQQSALTRPPRIPHTTISKQRIAAAKLGKTINLTDKGRADKSAKQKLKWAKRRADTIEFAKYIKNLSERRIAYIKIHGLTIPKKGKITSLEKRFILFLEQHNIQYNFQFFLDGKYYDFYIPTLHLLVEVDGEYWHRMVPAIKNDLEKHVLAKELKYNLLRITNLHWFPELIFESNYSKIISHNYAILNKRTIECQNYELAISIV
jgi:very-short-patch-repair endonuclease